MAIKPNGNPCQTLAHILTHLQSAQACCTCAAAAAEILEAINQIPRLNEEIESLERNLEERKLIEQAKGILMNRADLTEKESHNRLQKYATTSKTKMVDAARLMIQAEEIMNHH